VSWPFICSQIKREGGEAVDAAGNSCD